MKQCIIMGNGPSLLEMPHELLWEMDSFGANYCPYQPTFYTCVDHNILTTNSEAVYPLAAGAKIAFLAAKEAGSSRLYDLPNVQLIAKDAYAFKQERFFSGLTCTYVALKMAYYMGFDEAHLWGVDHSPDWAHYRDDYPRGDIDRRLERMEGMFQHYRYAASVYNQAGRRIINHSHPSKLDAIFERGKENQCPQ